MADINKTTNDVTIFDKDGNDAVNVIDDNGIKRFAVDARFTGITLSTLVNQANIFRSVVYQITSKADTIIDTYTVPSGKTFYITGFIINADHPLAIDCLLKVDGVTKIVHYLDPSFGSDNANTIFSSPTLFATVGQVVTITISPTAPRGEFNAILVGVEI